MTDIPRNYDFKGEFSETYPAPAGGWVCFHCGLRFFHQSPARRHFGLTPTDTPLCLLQVNHAEKCPARIRRPCECGVLAAAT